MDGMSDTSRPPAPVSLREATKVWAYVGVNSFGGPAGQIAVIHREVVDERRWISEKRFVHALNYCMLLPGPEAQQLATYVGWLMHGVRGGVIAGSLFVIPGFIVMMALSVMYALFGDVGWVSGLLFGLQAAVVAIVVQAVIRIGGRMLRSPFTVSAAVAAFVALFVFAVPFPYVVILAGLLGWGVGRVRPDWLGTGGGHASGSDGAAADEVAHLIADDETVPRQSARRALRAAAVCAVLWLVPVIALVSALGSDHVFAQEALLFSKTAVIGFGGAYAILTYVSQEAVATYGWLSPKDMTTGLALAETTPGPLVLVLQFVGFMAGYNHPGSLPPLVAGAIGAVIAAWTIFVPCFMFIFAGAPFVERLRHSPALRHALSGIGAAVVGVIANLAVWFAFTTFFSQTQSTRWGPATMLTPVPGSLVPWAIGIAVLAAILIFRLRWSTLRVLAVCALIGVALSLAGAL